MNVKMKEKMIVKMKVCRESIHADAPDYVEIPVNLLEIPGEK